MPSHRPSIFRASLSSKPKTTGLFPIITVINLSSVNKNHNDSELDDLCKTFRKTYISCLYDPLTTHEQCESIRNNILTKCWYKN